MIKRNICLLLASLMIFAALLCGCDTGSENADSGHGDIPDEDYAEIAVITDVGALRDKGFNQGTYEGVKAYAEEHNISYKYYQPTKGSEATTANRIAALNQAIAFGAKIIVAPGYQQADAIKEVAAANPQVKFVFLDGWALGLSNVTAVVYKEQESGYLAGYAAVKEGYTSLGFTGGGGGENPACNRFGYGFVQGCAAAAEEMNINVSVNYSYKHGAKFKDSDELCQQISGWYSSGVEIVFACGGSMFKSVKTAAESFPDAKIIGVDVDQSSESDRVVTSAVKGLSESVRLVLSQYYKGEWDKKLADKVQNLGAAENSTGLPTNNWKMKNFTVEQYTQVYEMVKSGKLTPDAVTPDNANESAEWLNISDNVKILFDK